MLTQRKPYLPPSPAMTEVPIVTFSPLLVVRPGSDPQETPFKRIIKGSFLEAMRLTVPLGQVHSTYVGISCILGLVF